MILPSQTVGILGGGQLGRMFAIAARRLGYRVHCFDPTYDGPTGQVADEEIIAAYDDLDAARRFAAGVDVVTFEFENIPAETLGAIAESRPVHPSPEVLHICRHRLREKEFLVLHGFPGVAYSAAVTPFAGNWRLAENDGHAGDSEDRRFRLRRQETECGSGRRQRCRTQAWTAMGRPLGVLEAFVPFVRELSVICAPDHERARSSVLRRPKTCIGHHILDVTTVPGDMTPGHGTAQASAWPTAITEALGVVGLLAVEMFELAHGGEVLVNELAAYRITRRHFTFDACVTSRIRATIAPCASCRWAASTC